MKIRATCKKTIEFIESWVVPILFLSSSIGLAGVSHNVVSFALDEEPPQLNSMKAADSQSFFVLGHIMEGLTRYDKSDGIVPGVAESWKLSQKGATFILRKNAKWSDGKPVTARDFVFAWRTTVDPKTASEYAFILYPIKNAEAINKGQLAPEKLGVVAKDDHTLEVQFEKPCGYFLSLTAIPTYLPVREDFYRAKGQRFAADSNDLLSDGPFILTSWIHGASLTMSKNPLYWNSSKIALDEINIPYITADNSARFNFYKDGKTDLLESLNMDDLQKAQVERYRMKSFAEGTLFYMEFNFRKGRATTNKNLRKAIQLVFNSSEFINKVVGVPGTKPGERLIPSWLHGVKDFFIKEFPIQTPKANIAEAKRLLADAKKELGGVIPPLVWLSDDTPLAAKEGEYFQSLLKRELGIDLRIDKQIFKQRLAKMQAGDFDIAAAGWGPDYPDPMTFADLMTTWNANNNGAYQNSKYDELIRKAQATTNPKSRMSAMAAAEKLAMEDVAIVPLYERTKVYVTRERVQGIVRHTTGPDPDFTFAKVVH